MRLDATEKGEIVATPDAWTTRVGDGLMDNQLAFRAHALEDGVMDEREQAIDDGFTALQGEIDEVKEAIAEYCHVVRVGRRSAWHTRKRRERQQMYGALTTAG